MRTIAEWWDSYRSRVLPADASAIQIMETRRAFYAGFQASLSCGLDISSPAVSEDAGVAMLEGLHDEARRFGVEVASGRA